MLKIYVNRVLAKKPNAHLFSKNELNRFWVGDFGHEKIYGSVFRYLNFRKQYLKVQFKAGKM